MAGSGLVRTETKGDVRLVWLLAPPGNLFGPALCAALMAALRAALDDVMCKGVVLASGLRAAGQGFSGGVDLADMARPWPAGGAGPADLVRLIVQARVPVIAALHGPTLGAGAELALAARGRVATPDMRLGLRDALVGRLPMAGGTQTLTRLIGAPEALRLIGQAGSIGAAEAVAMGAVDRVVDADDLIAAAIAMVQGAPAAERAPGLRDAKGFQAAVASGRLEAVRLGAERLGAGGLGAGGDAVREALLDCVEAAQLLPLEQGLAFEAQLAGEIAARPEAAALRHLMVSDMRMVADLAGGQPARKLGLWGAGTGPLILPALVAGFDVVLADDDRPALLQAIEAVALAQQEQVQAGRLSAAARDLEWARLHPALAAGDLQNCDLVIAAKPGAVGAVVQFGSFAGADAALPRLILLAPAFAEFQAPSDMRRFNQMVAATLRQMRLRLAVTDPVAGAEARAGAGASAGVGPALVGAAQRAMAALLAGGVQPDALRRALNGVLRLPVPQRAGPMPDGPLRDLPPAALVQRVLAAVAAEGARLLQRGAVARGGVIDVLAVSALGMPRAAGGPLFAADQRGLMLLRRDLQQWAHDHAVWAPVPLLDQLVSTGGRLAEVQPGATP